MSERDGRIGSKTGVTGSLGRTKDFSKEHIRNTTKPSQTSFKNPKEWLNKNTAEFRAVQCLPEKEFKCSELTQTKRFGTKLYVRLSNVPFN